MPSVGNVDLPVQSDLGTAIAPLNGDLCQRAKGIGGSNGSGGLLDSDGLLGKILP